ncbi:MAG TPA: hypothetical protein VGB96_19130, partial [Archangium sp.]
MTPSSRSTGWRVALLAAVAWLLPTPSSAANTSELPLRTVACTFTGMVDELRTALKTGSPAYRKYAKERLKQAARVMPV